MEGEFLDGVAHGKGKLTKSGGGIYSGEFYKGLQEGYGIFEELSGY